MRRSCHGRCTKMGSVTQRSVVLLGSTGSIGTQAVDVITRNPDRFTVTGLSAGGGDVDLLARQARELGVSTVAVADPRAAAPLREALPAASRCSSARRRRPSWPAAAPTSCSTASRARSGWARRSPRCGAGSTLALANKESLVVGGRLVHAARQRPDQIVPVDSEHSAIAQALRGGTHPEVRRLILTASGGPFRGWSHDDVKAVTPQQALAHPTWSMGPVVTINSSTLMNKGLELIEAHLLFDVPVEDITVVVHPQSVVHSMVEFVDGSTLAQASPPDMRLPIALGLSWPDRVPQVAPPCDWTQATAWTFEPLDEEVFAAVRLAREARRGLRDAPGGLQRGERGVRRGVPGRPDRVPRHRDHGRAGARRARRHRRRTDLTPRRRAGRRGLGAARAQEILARA